jgi:fused signal recognition particle receptor
MFKFWKKKPTDAPATPPPPDANTAPAETDASALPPVDTASLDSSTPAMVEALSDTLPPESDTPSPAAFPEPALAPAAAPAPAVPAPLEADLAAPADAPAEPAAVKRSWRERLSGSSFARGLSALFVRNPKLDDDLLDQLETTLITADVGVEASTALVEDLRRRMHKREFADAAALLAALRQALVAQLTPVEKPLRVDGRKPFVILTVGINGVGKTTTIGKLARRFRDEKHEVLLAAGDTFRAAAVEQLKTWGERNAVPVISQGQNADAASVIFDALQAARSRGTDVLIADTAGRLHTQGGLMDELGKIARVLKKLDADAPHEVLMVIDGTTGQNAINQVRQFLQIVGVSGLVVTKLDGTAKGGVVFALAREFGLPIRYVGLGETATDLRVFEAQAYVDGLLPASLGHG